MEYRPMKQFTRDGRTIIFYQEPGDAKYSFRVKDDEKGTRLLLANVKTKRVKEKGLKYAVSALFEKLKSLEGIQLFNAVFNDGIEVLYREDLTKEQVRDLLLDYTGTYWDNDLGRPHSEWVITDLQGKEVPLTEFIQESDFYSAAEMAKITGK